MDEARQKYLNREALWAHAGLGLHFCTVAFTIYISSVLGFLVQVEVLPEQWNAVEFQAMLRLLPGPGNWIPPADVHHLRRSLGWHAEFLDLREISLARRLRVYYRERLAAGGLHIRSKHRA